MSRKSYRRIADCSQNEFMANGVGPHKPTSVAPLTLIEPLSDGMSRQIANRQRDLERKLAATIGSPFYSKPGFILYCGDSLSLLSRLANAKVFVDLTVTSPPYNIGKEYESPLSIEQYVEWCGAWMSQIHKVTMPEGAFWLNVGFMEVSRQGLCVPIPYLIWNKSPFYLLQEVVWKYGAGVSAKRRLSPRNEKWLFYVKDPQRYTFNLDDIRDPNVKYPNQKKNGRFRCNPLGKNPSDIWEFPKLTTGARRSSKERTDHPTQFPLPVVERVIRASSKPAQIVLDVFAGSCSAGIAAAGLGRLFVGFEISDNYCRLAVRRFEKFQLARMERERQPNLF